MLSWAKLSQNWEYGLLHLRSVRCCRSCSYWSTKILITRPVFGYIRFFCGWSLKQYEDENCKTYALICFSEAVKNWNASWSWPHEVNSAGMPKWKCEAFGTCFVGRWYTTSRWHSLPYAIYAPMLYQAL